MPTVRLLVLLLLAAPLGAFGGIFAALALLVVPLALVAACLDWFLTRDGLHTNSC